MDILAASRALMGYANVSDIGLVIATVEPGSPIVYASACAHELFGYEPGELMGLTIVDLIPSDVRHPHGRRMAGFAVADGPTRHRLAGVVTGQRKGGERFDVRVYGRMSYVVGKDELMAALVADPAALIVGMSPAGAHDESLVPQEEG